MSSKKVLIVVGTRPNFIKVTRFKDIAKKEYPSIDIKIAHTGQHYDYEMAEVFFKQLDIEPDYFLNIPNEMPSTQMGHIMVNLEELIEKKYYPDLIIVPGDVNSTLAAALVANKKRITLAHLESGLRSFDNDMPEEINRILTDRITDHFFVTEQSGIDHIKSEKLEGSTHFVGNTMIDTLVHFENEIKKSNITSDLEVNSGEFVLTTIHRPSNVDEKEDLLKLISLLRKLGEKYKVVFPVHPRTHSRLKEYDLEKDFAGISNLVTTKSLGYLDFQNLILNARFILTDSGGIQEESTFSQVPCLTLRNNTERPITTEIGSNKLIPFSIEKIIQAIDDIESGKHTGGEVPPLWDGKATNRILAIIEDII